jgi:hypothetical protein
MQGLVRLVVVGVQDSLDEMFRGRSDFLSARQVDYRHGAIIRARYVRSVDRHRPARARRQFRVGLWRVIHSLAASCRLDPQRLDELWRLSFVDDVYGQLVIELLLTCVVAESERRSVTEADRHFRFGTFTIAAFFQTKRAPTDDDRVCRASTADRRDRERCDADDLC